ncbi:MAG: 23S rRNA (guanosine(2251)-2'-O)-methyltransferase RlmB [Verrucomicrobiota bacterium]
MPRRRAQNVRARANAHVADRQIVDRIDEDELIERLGALEEDPFILALDQIQDPHNLGACLRTADAAGVHAVIAPQHRAVGITDTVRRISVGAADNVPYVQVVNLGRTLDRFKEMGIWLVGTGDEESELIYTVNLTGPLCMVMGSEAEGIRNKTGRKCDHLVKVPMNGTVDCLNVSVATGVCLFEAVRQRG